MNGIPVSFTFSILLNEVHDFWFDEKIISQTAIHKIQFDVLKKDYKIKRSWEIRTPIVVKNFDDARELISKINGLEVISLARLKKGEHYQLKVKSGLNNQISHFSGVPYDFETDWYTINFIY